MRQTRRSALLLPFALWFVPAMGAEPASTPPQSPENFVLENTRIRIEVDREHGRVLRVLDKAGKIDLKSPLELAENFRLLVSLPEDPRNCVYGKDQPLSQCETTADSMVLHWDGPIKDQRGIAHDLAATMTVALEGEAVSFRFHLDNHTQLKVMEVWYPALGGLLHVGPPESAAQAQLNPPPHDGKRMRAPFGQHLVPYPSQNMGFVDIDNAEIDRGVYLGAHDPVARFKTFNFIELKKERESNVVLFLTHYPFVPPGGSFEGSPLVVQFHKGGWIAAGKQIYRPWFIKQFGLMKPENDWLRRESFFQMIMIMLPEGNINYMIRDIPQLARDGLKYGVKALQIAGWQFGGHDNGYPYYEPDPRLGTWDDLKEAIREVHEMGVKINFFANLDVANIDTAWYKAELKNYAFETTSGASSWVAGWGMGTLASRMGITVPLMAFLDPSFPGFADGQLRYFKKLAEVGADGIHFDKTFPQPISFNPRVRVSPDQAPWEGTIRLVERIDRECRAIHPDFRLSFEVAWDRVLSYADSTWWAGNMSVARKVFPELVETVGLSAPYDYITVNNAVRNGHAIMIDPHDFCRSMDSPAFQGLAGYIRDVKRIRDELTDYVFLGEQLDPKVAQFAKETPLPPRVEQMPYVHLKNGKRACIISNNSATRATVTLNGLRETPGDRVRLYRPGEAPAGADLPAAITVEPERIVFVVEE